MSHESEPGIVASFAEGILKWWVVIAGAMALVWTGIKKFIIAPRKELDRLSSAMEGVNGAIDRNVEQLDELNKRIDRILEYAFTVNLPIQGRRHDDSEG